jgi:cholesterol transport system auxiliary component
MNKMPIAHVLRLATAALSLMALCGCGALSPTTTPPPNFYSLNSLPGAGAGAVAAPTAAPTLIINPPHAAAGFDSARIIYLREPHKLEYFAHSEWVDPPPHMLGDLLVAAIEKSGAFRAVVLAPSAAVGDLRLDTEIIRLQHEFQTRPSRVRFTLRATLVDDKTRRVLARREFDDSIAAASDDTYGGVVAANRAVQTVLESLSVFCAEAARSPRTEK